MTPIRLLPTEVVTIEVRTKVSMALVRGVLTSVVAIETRTKNSMQ